MKALTVIPKQAGSLQVREIDEPKAGAGELLCEMLMIGICGTDKEISKGLYGTAPAGAQFLTLGHESLGRVLTAPEGSPFQAGDLVMGFVRRPDPVPCRHCGIGEWDLCENDQYQERGINGLQGYASERYTLEENFALKLDPKLEAVGVLMEPTSVVAKAWEQTLKLSRRSEIRPESVLITGSGPVGLLAAMIGQQKGLNVHLFDHNASGPKPERAAKLGVNYHSNLESLERLGIRFDLMIECTGVPEVVFNLMNHLQSDGILCLTGVSSAGKKMPVDIGDLNLQIVLQNKLIFGSVNANRRHYEQARDFLTKADPQWLASLITRKVPLDRALEAFEKQKSDVKVVLIGNPRA